MAPSRSTLPAPESRHEAPVDGQNYDRIEPHPNHAHHEFSPTLGSPDEDEGEVSVSSAQKMLSAVTGSILTSLLGMYFPHVESNPL
jgi:hypothetical protein